MKDGKLELFAASVLDENEMKLAKHLSVLLDNDKYDAASLIAEILPGGGTFTAYPISIRSVYRSIYYLYSYATCDSDWFRLHTRGYVSMTFHHLEGCLHWLATNTPGVTQSLLRQPFGALVKGLGKLGALHIPLNEHLTNFNLVANVPAKHMNAILLDSDLDKRSFSVLDASLALILMRKFSMQMFDILRNNGETIPQEWTNFNQQWLSWNRLIEHIPREHKR